MSDLQAWLARIQQLHPLEIDLGLDRLRQVARRLGLGGSGWKLAPKVITVAGTNGKGSHVATLDAVVRALGYQVGCYTSPHLLRYNERVTINGKAVSDAALVSAFEQIELARENISLSYFEFATLAAFLIFRDAGLDVVVLEVGMGGRLDAVNLIDADVAVVATIDLDHQQWLGDTREAIAVEKAGIMRPGKPVVSAETHPPSTLFEAAYALSCPLHLPGRDYSFEEHGDRSWRWQGKLADSASGGSVLVLENLPMPRLSLNNVASALQALCLSGLVNDVTLLQQRLPDVLSGLCLQGRQQWISTPITAASVLLDVAHNPHAAGALAKAIQKWRERQAIAEEKSSGNVKGRVSMVLAMMADKDHQGFYRALENDVDIWYIAHVELARCMPAQSLSETLQALHASSKAADAGASGFQAFNTVAEAFSSACAEACAQDMIVVAGSFVTVAEVMSVLDNAQPSSP